MGGSGSTRWNLHYKKTTVEDCLKLTIHDLKAYLIPYGRGNSTWTRGDRQIGAISYMMAGQDYPVSIRLIYTHTDRRTGEKINLDYPVPLTFTLTPWGARRYWFTCPLRPNWQTCGRRVGALYLPPGGRYFGCRHCYNLTYRSSQTSGEHDSVYRMFAMAMQDSMPGATAADMRFMFEVLDNNKKGKPPRGGYFEREAQARLAALQEYLDNLPDPYASYLTASDLCAQSGLTLDDLAELGDARLLLPDHDGKYRPKLAGWARKLAYLLGEGWTSNEVRAWARGRWTTTNPRQFPPDRADWRSGNY